MKKIMIVSSSAGMGGVEKSSMVLAQSLFEQGYQVFFLNLINNPSFFELPSEITFAQPNGYNRNRFQLFKTLTFIRRNVKKFDPDVIIAYTRFYASVTNIAVLGTRYRVVFTERSAPDYIWPWHINLFFKLSVRL